MHLWTEYEGRTIAGAYTLEKLLRSEGRNGFFATSDTTGNSAVIRLTESHFDEEEVLKRWRQVAELHQANLIEIEHVGQTKLDDVALTYALMEKNDANLEDVLKERPLTATETTEVAKSVLAAVKTLHASGMVHEHIEPVNVLAVGEVVKLRSDCVRECVADGEFTSEEACAELRQRDLRDFGTLLLRCLTLERELTPGIKLAEPFNRVVPGAMEGTLTLEQLDAVLNPPTFTPAGNAPAYLKPAATAAPIAEAGPRPPLVPSGVRSTASASGAAAADAPPLRSPQPEPAIPLRARPAVHDAAQDVEPSGTGLHKLLLLSGAVALLAAFLLWHLFSGRSAAPIASNRPALSAPAEPGSPSAGEVGASPAASGLRAEAPHSATPTATARIASGWYVIAYTYHYEAQARAKAASLSRHTGLHATVFSPSGRAPYLVSVGGPMTEREAEETSRRARHAGSPRDTFIRRY